MSDTTDGVPASSRLPLEGITVVSCEQAVAAPFATRQLADLGARVIKVERPDTGDFARGYDETVRGLSSHFVWLNRSKESVAIDLKHAEAPEVMRRLIDRADVFVQNLAPLAAERLGLGSHQLRERDQRLIACSISGYGTSGPFRDARAYDLLIQAETGLISITGTEAAPAKSGIPVADIGAGMYAFAGILEALYSRERTGQGATINVSLFDSLMEWMGYPIYYTQYGGAAPQRSGTSHAAIAPYGIYECADGQQYVLSVQNDREWKAFCTRVLERPELVEDPRFVRGSRRVANRGELDTIISQTLSSLDGVTFQRRLETARIAHARSRGLADVLDHPQLVARDRWREVDSSTGPIRALLPPISVEGQDVRMGPIPAVGQHTRRILVELGYTQLDIAQMADEQFL